LNLLGPVTNDAASEVPSIVVSLPPYVPLPSAGGQLLFWATVPANRTVGATTDTVYLDVVVNGETIVSTTSLPNLAALDDFILVNVGVAPVAAGDILSADLNCPSGGLAVAGAQFTLSAVAL